MAGNARTIGGATAPIGRPGNVAVGRTVTEVRITGTVTGGLWWPYGAAIGKPFRVTLNPERESPAHRGPEDSFAAMVAAELDAQGGDFSSAPRLTADTGVIVRRVRWALLGHTLVTRERWYPVTAFPSLSALVAADTYSDLYDETEDY
jgi:hypothetical protein